MTSRYASVPVVMLRMKRWRIYAHSSIRFSLVTGNCAALFAPSDPQDRLRVWGVHPDTAALLVRDAHRQRSWARQVVPLSCRNGRPHPTSRRADHDSLPPFVGRPTAAGRRDLSSVHRPPLLACPPSGLGETPPIPPL